MKRNHFLLLSILLTFSIIPASAQKTTLTGRVYDSESGEALVHATVQVMTPDSASMVTGGITNTNGTFTIKGIDAGSYVVKISYIGYHNFFRPLQVKSGAATTNRRQAEQEVNFGTVMLLPSSVMLESAVVTGTMRQIEVKEDTLIFNADAFKVPEGSVLEELIRKLPGAEVSDDGTVKINGKTVSKILVGGKEFFGNDKSMAMKNLPSEIVDKVKTYDRQSEMARMTGIDDGEEETVIDLSIKKGMQNGWFGNADLGAGTKDRFAERLNANRFADGTQASLIANWNNVNDRSMGGGRGGNGVTTRQNVGGNIALDRGKWEIGGNVRYNGSKTDSWNKSSSQNFVTTRNSFSNSFNQSVNRNHSTNGDFRIEWKPDSMTTLNFRPSFSLGGSNSHGVGESATFNADPYSEETATGEVVITDPLHQMDLISNDIKVNLNNSGNRSKSDNYSFNGNLILNRRLNNVGRNFSLNLRGSYSNNESRTFNLSDVKYFQFGDSVNLTYRYRTTPNWNKNFLAGFNYTEPLIAKTLFLQLNYRFNYSKRHSDGKAYDMGDVEYLVDSIRNTGAGFLPLDYYQYLDADLSRYTDNENQIHNTDLQLRWVTQKVNMNAGVSFEQQHQRVDYQYQGLDTIASRNFLRISPTLNFRYKFNKQHTLRIRYRGNTQQPEITDMFNMTDNSNPLNIRLGNPDLKPSFTNNINIDWNNYVTTTMRNYVARLTFRSVLNSISNRTEYNEQTGGRITRPENINGNWNVNGNFVFTTPLFADNFTVSTNSSASYQNQVGYIYQNQETLKNNVKQTVLGERLTLTYRENKDLLSYDIGLTGNLNYNHTRSQLVPTNNRDTYDFSYGLNSNLSLNNGLAFSTNISMQSRRGYSASTMNTNELIWNAQASYRFLKNKQATVSLQAFDILANRSNISRTISATMRSDSENNAINSYVMAHFIYRLNLFGSRSARQDMRNSRRGEDNTYSDF